MPVSVGVGQIAGHRMPVVPFDQNPAAGSVPPALPPLGRRRDRPREDLCEEIQEPRVIVEAVGLVTVKERFARVGEIFVVVLVQLDDFLNERLVAGKIRAVQEAARIEPSAINGLPQ